ncbi:hypothetical protein [Sciscionella sediminilitoris]|nr:hypothetical protein [Sciscionella sp. SE31]
MHDELGDPGLGEPPAPPIRAVALEASIVTPAGVPQVCANALVTAFRANG